jgi:hypothetical protein
MRYWHKRFSFAYRSFQTLFRVLVALWSSLHAHGQFVFDTSPDGIKITGYTGTNANVIIPESIDGLPVTSIVNGFAFNTHLTNIHVSANVSYIADDVLIGCSSLRAITVDPSNADFSSVAGVLFDKRQTSLRCFPAAADVQSYAIPTSVTNIANFAFYACQNLATVSIPGSIFEIGRSAFFNCVNLTNLTIAEGVFSFGNYAFGNCTKLATITIPATLSNAGYGPFSGCSALKQILVNRGNPTYFSLDGVLCEQAAIIQFPAAKTNAYEIPDSIVAIQDDAFSNSSNLSAVFFHKAVGYIGHFAFARCPKLASLSFAGDAPLTNPSAFSESDEAIIFYPPGATGWTQNFDGVPAVPLESTIPSLTLDWRKIDFPRMIISAEPGKQIALESVSTMDVQNDWQTVFVNSYSGNPIIFSDTNTTTFAHRFYRARSVNQ